MSLLTAFPHLRDEGYRETSPATPMYNCVAWAAGDDGAWWWPDALGLAYWPERALREETIGAFEQAFATLGFERCLDASHEPRQEKIAVYAKAKVPTHVARQLPNGRWTSKLGQNVDIEHTLNGSNGGDYGEAVLFMKRRRN